jgi:hypothetical protein
MRGASAFSTAHPPLFSMAAARAVCGMCVRSVTSRHAHGGIACCGCLGRPGPHIRGCDGLGRHAGWDGSRAHRPHLARGRPPLLEAFWHGDGSGFDFVVHRPGGGASRRGGAFRCYGADAFTPQLSIAERLIPHRVGTVLRSEQIRARAAADSRQHGIPEQSVSIRAKLIECVAILIENAPRPTPSRCWLSASASQPLNRRRKGAGSMRTRASPVGLTQEASLHPSSAVTIDRPRDDSHGIRQNFPEAVAPSPRTTSNAPP